MQYCLQKIKSGSTFIHSKSCCMKLKNLLTLATVCGILFFTACKKSKTEVADCNTLKATIDTLIAPHQTKGYELYSWPACNDWYYAIAVGTNSLKTYDEVTGKTTSSRFLIKIFGKENLKTVLHKLPAGEAVFWAGEGWLKTTWGTGYNNLQLPPATIVNKLQQYSTQIGINMGIGY